MVILRVGTGPSLYGPSIHTLCKWFSKKEIYLSKFNAATPKQISQEENVPLLELPFADSTSTFGQSACLPLVRRLFVETQARGESTDLLMESLRHGVSSPRSADSIGSPRSAAESAGNDAIMDQRPEFALKFNADKMASFQSIFRWMVELGHLPTKAVNLLVMSNKTFKPIRDLFLRESAKRIEKV